MKLIIITLLSLMSYQVIAQEKTLTPQEREQAIQLLKQTETGVFNAVRGLSEAQLNFKAAPDKWSVAECIKHIAAAEKELWAMEEPALAAVPNPDKKGGLIFKDDATLIKAVEDRTQKSKTFAALEPANSPYKTVPEALEAFKAGREKLIALVKSTKADLREHILVLPVGTFDSYQFILLIAAHSNRHTQQITEVMANVNFPPK